MLNFYDLKNVKSFSIRTNFDNNEFNVIIFIKNANNFFDNNDANTYFVSISNFIKNVFLIVF